MRIPLSSTRSPITQFRSFAFCSLLIATGLTSTPVRAAAGEPGTVTGTVSNIATRNLLDGAVVQLREPNRSTLTDRMGRFVFDGIAPGTYTLSVSYTGLNEFSRTVSLAPGATVDIGVELRTEIYTLDAYTVTGEREGNAASLTRQRYAATVRNIVAMDAFGNLPNDNVGEILMRLPGVAGFQSNDDTTSLIAVRGLAPDLNTFSVDGVLQANANGFGRGLRTTGASGSLFDEVEIIKALSPENSADSIGGQINMRSRSAFSQKEKRRVSFRTQLRWVPRFFEAIPLRRPHPVHPLANATYSELFDAFGGQRNLGITTSLSYSQNVSAFWRAIQMYPTTNTDFPAPTSSYNTTNNLNYRFSSGATIKAEYKLTPATQLWASYMHSQISEPWQRNIITNAVANTAAIDPSFTDDLTRIRRNTANRLTLGPQLNSYRQMDDNLGAGVRFRSGRWQIDADTNYSASFAKTAPSDAGNGARAGSLSVQMGDFGWEVDRSHSKIDPEFRWTDGLNPYDPLNFTISPTLTQNSVRRWANNALSNLNIRYDLPGEIPVVFKSGGRFRSQEINETTRANTYSYVGTARFLSNFTTPAFRTTFGERMGRDFPWADPAEVGASLISKPTLWSPNVYNYWQRYYQGTRDAGENVAAGYAQGEAEFGRLRLLTGIRGERTDVESNGYVQSRTLTTTAQRTVDPVGSAQRDYANPRQLRGSYTDWFPSAHASWRFTKNLKGRLAWSNSIGRPALVDLLPSLAFNDTAQTVTVNNPALKPQSSENWDAALEYYFEPVGTLRVNWFQKTMKDFIVRGVRTGRVAAGVDNGFNGEFANYDVLTNVNSGGAKVKGWEFEYWQQFSFLPSPFRGLGFQANFTILDTQGDYGGTTPLASNRVQNFVPHSGNAAITYNYRGFNLRVGANYTGVYLHANSTVVASLFFREPRTVLNANLGYYVTKNLSIYCDLQNFTNEPQLWYRYRHERPGDYNVNTASINVGLSGRY